MSLPLAEILPLDMLFPLAPLASDIFPHLFVTFFVIVALVPLIVTVPLTDVPFIVVVAFTDPVTFVPLTVTVAVTFVVVVAYNNLPEVFYTGLALSHFSGMLKFSKIPSGKLLHLSEIEGS